MSARRRKRKPAFSFDALRKREIERYARCIGAAETDDFDALLIAWAWHNQQSNDPIWALKNAAQRMGGSISEAHALHILEEADRGRHWKADPVGRYLGLTYLVRKELKITTIGAKDVRRRARKVLRKRRDRLYQERRRRAAGARPRSESLSQTKPWEAMNMSRRTWERHRNKVRDAKTSAACFLILPDDGLASARRVFESEAKGRGNV